MNELLQAVFRRILEEVQRECRGQAYCGNPNAANWRILRAIAFELNQGVCAVCEKPVVRDEGGWHIHHYDGDAGNNCLDNLILLHLGCHISLETSRWAWDGYYKGFLIARRRLLVEALTESGVECSPLEVEPKGPEWGGAVCRREGTAGEDRLTELRIPKVLLTTKEVAERLSMRHRTVYHYIRSGRIKAKKFGRHWYIHPSDVEVFLEERGKKQ